MQIIIPTQIARRKKQFEKLKKRKIQQNMRKKR